MRTELKQNEEVILETKTHWISMVLPFIFCLILFLISIILIGVNSKVGYLIFVFSVGYFVYKIYYRKFNIWIVTNNRVLDEKGVFKLQMRESPLEKLNNIDYEQGLIGRMLNFGDVSIHTAAFEGKDEKFKQINNPKKFKDTISNMKDELIKSINKSKVEELANMMNLKNNVNNDSSSELEKLHNLKEKGAISEDEYNTLKSKLINS